ncbi:MAG: hypothetical protein ACI9WU_001808 [Myxococcota bacterium]|jgi:hypothetical protein
MQTMGSSGRKRPTGGTLTSLAAVLGQSVRQAPWMHRLHSARRLFATVVGPGLAADCAVTALYEADLVVSVRRHAMIRTLESLEPYALRMLDERLSGRVTKVRYTVDEQLGSGQAAHVAKAACTPQLDAAHMSDVQDVVSDVDEGLREALMGWMVAALAKETNP